MFVGTFEHSLDGKGRVVLPAAFRNQIAERGFLSQYEGCLGVWTAEGFADMAARLTDKVRGQEASNQAIRAFSSSATEVVPDSQGRIFIPQRLRERANLDREVVIIGALQHIEIWDAQRWENLQSHADASFQEAVSELGI